MESFPSFATNTNSRLSCFFCLRSNSRKYLNPQLETDSCGNAEEAVSSFHEFSLRNLYRLFNLLHSDKQERDFNDLKMPICENCSRLTFEFNELYNLLEEIKLRLNWCILKMEDVMTKAKKRNDIKEVENDENIFEMWRTRTLNRMTAFTHSSFPRVLLRKRESPWIREMEKAAKMRVEVEKVMTTSTLKAEPMDEQMKWPHPLSSYSDNDDHTSLHEVKVDNPCDVKPSIPTVSKMQAFPEDVKLDVQMKCDVSEPFVKMKSSSSVAVDSTEGFVNDDVSSTENASQEENASQAIEVKHSFRVRRRGPGRPAFMSDFAPVSTNRRKVCCNSCRKIVNRIKAFNHWKNDCINPRQQLKFQHKTELKEGLKVVLEDPLLDDRCKSRVRRNRNRVFKIRRSKYPSVCPYCKFKTTCRASNPARGSMVGHLASFHPEYFLIDEKEKASGLLHNEFRTILNKMVYPDFILKDGHQRSCSSCSKIFKYKYASQSEFLLKRHLIFCHKSELKKKLETVLEDPLLKERLKTSNKTPRTIRNLELIKAKYSSGCAHCSYKAKFPVGTPSSVVSQAHLIRFHPEHILINEKDKAAGLWHGQLRTILTNMIYPDFIIKEDGHQRSCLLCGKVCRHIQPSQNVDKLRRHLLIRHKSELKAKLIVILEDPLLEERLKSFHSNPSRLNSINLKDNDKFSSDCLYCSYKTPAPAGSMSSKSSMLNHLVRFHPEHYLIDEKDKAEGLWHEQFPKILTNMIYPKFSLNEGHHRSCSLCGKIYDSAITNRNKTLLIRHLVFHHKLELKENLRVVLEDPLLEEKLSSCNLSRREPRTQTTYKKREAKRKYYSSCPYCGYKSTSRAGGSSYSTSATEVHLIRFHPEHYLIDEKDRASGLWHEQFPTILKNMIYPSFVMNVGRNKSCTLCGAMYKSVNSHTNTMMLRRHLIFNHKTELKEKFKTILEDPSFEQKLKKDNVAVPARQKCCSIEETYSTNCTYCSFKSNSPSDSNEVKRMMVNHIVRFHPEHYLIDDNDRASGLWHEQFRTILINIVYPHFISKVGHHRSCSSCGVAYKCANAPKNALMMKRHLIFHHKVELKQKFKDILDDPLLEQKLKEYA